VRRTAVVVLSAVLLGSAAGASAGGSDRPTLRLTRAKPLTVAGSQFVAQERVRVTVSVDGRRAAKRVTAGRRGAFVAGFASLESDRCNGLLVTAMGSQGSQATLKRPGLQCPPKL
jgi:hypothetical protein